jgi:hypothetical protein
MLAAYEACLVGISVKLSAGDPLLQRVAFCTEAGAARERAPGEECAR